MKSMNARVQFLFCRTVNIVYAVILLFLVLGIAIGTVHLTVSIWELLRFKGAMMNYVDIISRVLTLYVLVELSRSLAEYFDSQKLRLTFIVDAGIVFVLREVLIGLFTHSMSDATIYAMSTLLFVLGALRIGSVIVYQREQQITG